MDIAGFVADHMGHFSMVDLPRIVFSLAMAGALTWVMVRVAGGQESGHERVFVLWSIIAAAGTLLVRGQLPVAVVFLALVLLVRPRSGEVLSSDRSLAALVIGMGCGSGASLVTAMVAFPLALLMRWVYRAKR